MILLNGDGGVGAREGFSVEESAALEGGADGAGFEISELERIEDVRLDGLDGAKNRGVILKPDGVGAVLDDAIEAADFNLLAVVFEHESHERLFGSTAIILNAHGVEKGQKHAAIRGPAKTIHGVRKSASAASEFVALNEAAALAVRFLNPDVIVLNVVLLGVNVVANGIGDAGVGGKREGGDVFVDVVERLVEILGGKRAA